MKILFVGNSHTYANALPFQVRAMIDRTEGVGTCDVHAVTPGGKSLHWHAGEPGSCLGAPVAVRAGPRACSAVDPVVDELG